MKLKSTLTALTLGAVMATGVGVAVLAQTSPAPMGGPMMGGPIGTALFAQIDTNGDKLLSPEEIRAYVAGQIKGLDANNDGFLTADEIAAKMTQLAHDRILARATAMVARLDKTGGGKVSVSELAAMPMPMDRMVERMLKAGGGKITKETFDTLQAMREGMGEHGMGRDGGDHGPADGGWRNWWHHRSGGEGGSGEGRGPKDRMGDMGPGMMGDMGPGMMGAGMMGAGMMGPGMMGAGGPIKFADIDTAGHGYITADDIQAYKLARIKAIDANGDGFITPEEVATFAMAKMEPRIKAHADDLVKRLDLNGDGKLSIEELAAAPMDMMFARLPTDKDGNVTEQGFLRAMHEGGHGGRHHDRDGMAPPAAGAPDEDGGAGN